MRNRIPLTSSPLFCAAAASFLLGAGYVLGVSFFQVRTNVYLSPVDLYLPRTLDFVIIVWSFWVGSSVGSFLNVVAWRMPRGESINGRSHCPRCLTRLNATDNFPVFGWIALRGRCRTCRLPISPRYPIVETLVGLSLTVVAVAEVYGFSLPRQTQGSVGPLWFPVLDNVGLITLVYHAVGLAVCWAVGLIRFDGNRLPANLQTFALAIISLPVLAFPTLMVVTWQMEVSDDWQPHGRYVDAVLRVITAMVAATALGRYLAKGFCPAADPKLDPLGKSTTRLIDLIVILAVPSIIVGWQALPAIIVFACVLAFWSRAIFPSRCDALGRFAISMPFALTFQMVFWRRLDSVESATYLQYAVWPSENASPGVMLFWLLMVGLVPLWLKESSDADVRMIDDDKDQSDRVFAAGGGFDQNLSTGTSIQAEASTTDSVTNLQNHDGEAQLVRSSDADAATESSSHTSDREGRDSVDDEGNEEEKLNPDS